MEIMQNLKCLTLQMSHDGSRRDRCAAAGVTAAVVAF